MITQLNKFLQDAISVCKEYFEQGIWAIALLFLYHLDVSPNALSFCFFRLIGFESCMGCGIGHSIHHALHLDLVKSTNEHMMGIPSIFFLILRIFKPFFKNNYQHKLYGSKAANDAKRPSA